MIAAFTKARLRVDQVLMFAVMIGTLATLLHGYSYAQSDQFEQLPLIRRYLDPGFAAGDYSVDAMSAFSPRYYYVIFVGTLAKLIPLNILFLLLTCFQHAAIAAVTFFVARKLFASSDLPAMVSTVLVMAVGSVELGGAAHLVAEYLVPRSLMLFLALWCVWEGINLKPIRCALIAMVGSFIHPQVALQAAALGYGTIAISLIFKAADDGSMTRDQSRRLWIKWITSGLAFGVFNFFFWFLPLRGQSPSRESLDYLIQFRAPHVHLPSTYPLEQYAAMLLFVVAGVWLWKMWYDELTTERPLARRFGMAALLVLIFLVCGYVFVEWIPLGPFLSAQAFRSVGIFKWLVLILLGGTVARLILGPRPAGAWFLASAFGQAQPAIVFVGTLLEYVKRKWDATLAKSSYNLLFVLACVAQLALLAIYRGGREAAALVIMFGAAALFLRFSQAWFRNGFAFCVALGALLILMTGIDAISMPIPKSITRRVVQQKTSEEKAIEDIAVYARDHSAPGSIFLTPPDFGRFRLASERALLVDFKMFPFSETDISEWRSRMTSAYGPTSGSGWKALEEMQQSYKNISDERIRSVAADYKLSYAVLYSDTPTQMLVLLGNNYYKLVQIR